MALVHKDSSPCAIQQLDLFQTLPTCSQIKEAGYVPYYSINPLDSATNVIEFAMQGSGNLFIDLARTELLLTCKIKDGNEDLKDRSLVAPVANAIASFFSQCDVFLNNKLVTSANSLYPYQAYLSTLLTYGRDTADKQLTLQMFYPDTAGKFDEVNNNAGFVKRKSLIDKSKTFQICGPLYTDVTSQPCALLNSVDLRIRLTRSSNGFALMAFDTAPNAANPEQLSAANAKVVIESAVLKVWMMTLTDEAQLGIEKVLHQRNAVYNLQRTELKSFTISGGDSEFTREHISLGLSPKYAYVVMVDTEAQQGHRTRNPFDFKHYKLKQMSLNIDGKQVPANGINTDYANGKYAEAYKSVLDTCGKWRTDDPFIIDYSDYQLGYNIYGFKIAPEVVPGAFNLVRNSNIRLDLKFAERLEKNVTVIVLFVYDATLEINGNREVFYDFSS